MPSRMTVENAIAGTTFSIGPANPGSGITINGITLTPDRIIHHDHRIDIREKNKDNVAFIIEHPVAAVTVLGIHDATITGTRERWDFYRAADREAFARQLLPNSILGMADGSIASDIADASLAIVPAEDVSLDLYHVKEMTEFEVDASNKITIEPPDSADAGLEISVQLFDLGPIHAVLEPGGGLLDDNGSIEIRSQVLRARSSAVIGLNEEAILHALGDVVGDIAGTGNIRQGKVTAMLGFAYHRTTIGLIKHVIASSLIERSN